MVVSPVSRSPRRVLRQLHAHTGVRLPPRRATFCQAGDSDLDPACHTIGQAASAAIATISNYLESIHEIGEFPQIFPKIYKSVAGEVGSPLIRRFIVRSVAVRRFIVRSVAVRRFFKKPLTGPLQAEIFARSGEGAFSAGTGGCAPAAGAGALGAGGERRGRLVSPEGRELLLDLLGAAVGTTGLAGTGADQQLKFSLATLAGVFVYRHRVLGSPSPMIVIDARGREEGIFSEFFFRIVKISWTAIVDMLSSTTVRTSSSSGIRRLCRVFALERLSCFPGRRHEKLRICGLCQPIVLYWAL